MTVFVSSDFDFRAMTRSMTDSIRATVPVPGAGTKTPCFSANFADSSLVHSRVSAFHRAAGGTASSDSSGPKKLISIILAAVLLSGPICTAHTGFHPGLMKMSLSCITKLIPFLFRFSSGCEGFFSFRLNRLTDIFFVPFENCFHRHCFHSLSDNFACR